MTERRSLIEGLKPVPKVDPALEEQFVYNKKPQKTASAPRRDHEDTQPKEQPAQVATLVQPQQADPSREKTQPLNTVGRTPLTTRVRSDIASALKRASLERQLAGVQPNTLQDILEEALEPWLRSKGYLK